MFMIKVLHVAIGNVQWVAITLIELYVQESEHQCRTLMYTTLSLHLPPRGLPHNSVIRTIHFIITSVEY